MRAVSLHSPPFPSRFLSHFCSLSSLPVSPTPEAIPLASTPELPSKLQMLPLPHCMMSSPRPWEVASIDGDIMEVDAPVVTIPSTLGLPPLIDGDISHTDDPMEVDDPEGVVSLD
jgi:hypothetical protein